MHAEIMLNTGLETKEGKKNQKEQIGEGKRNQKHTTQKLSHVVVKIGINWDKNGTKMQ